MRNLVVVEADIAAWSGNFRRGEVLDFGEIMEKRTREAEYLLTGLNMIQISFDKADT